MPKSVVMCQITSFVITDVGDVDHFTAGKMENIYQVDERYYNFLERQVKELKKREKSEYINQCV